METVQLGISPLQVGAIAYGCWRFAESSVSDATVKINTALDAGMTLIDTADIYGLGESTGFGGAEAVLGNVLKQDKSLREQMVLATKGGIDAIRPYDNSYDYLMTAIDKSLSRLSVATIDLYQIHRPDITTPMTEIARFLDDIIQAGKARYVGVSNFTPSQTRALQAHLKNSLITTQPEFSAIEQAPIVDGTLDLSMEHRMTTLAWSPLAGGELATGKSKDATDIFMRVIKCLDRLAETYTVERSLIALAFTMGHGADVIPIIGTQNIDRIKQSAQAADIPLTGRDFYDIVEAYRGESMP